MTTAPPPTADAQRFLHALFRGRRGTLFVCQGEHVRGSKERVPNTWRQNAYTYPQAAVMALDAAVMASEAGADAYVSVRLFTGRKRDKNACLDVDVLYADGDGCTLPDGFPEPSIVLETSPGHFHYFWILSRPIAPAVADDLGQRLAHHIGADLGGWDATQVLRLPGTRNYTQPGTPLVQFVCADENRTYDAEMFERILPALPARAAAAGPVIDGDEPPIDLSGYDLEIYQGRHPKLKADGSVDRSESLWKVAGTIYDAGATRSLVQQVAAERDQALGYNRYIDRPEEYARIADKLCARERQPKTPTPIRPSVDPLSPAAFDDSACADQVVRLEARITVLEQQNVALLAENRQLVAERSAIMAVKRNPAVRTIGNIALSLVFDHAQQQRAGRGDADGWTKVITARIAESAGVTAKTQKGKSEACSRAIEQLKTMGFCDKDVKTRFVGVDQETGEEINDYRSETLVRIDGSVLDQLWRLAELDPAPKPEGKAAWGGKREPKPKHTCPECGVFTEVDLHAHCGECGHDYGAIDDSAASDTLWQQVAEIVTRVNRQDHDSLPNGTSAMVSAVAVDRSMGRQDDDSQTVPLAGTCPICGYLKWRPAGAVGRMWACQDCRTAPTTAAVGGD